MGVENIQLWNELLITLTQNWFVHPLDSSRKIYVFADVQHVFNNITQAFLKHGAIKISKDYQLKYKLPSDTAQISHIKDIFKIDEQSIFKLTPRIEEFMFSPNNFQKMRVRNSYEIMHPDVASTLRFVADGDKTKENYKTTALVVEKVSYWQRTLTSRNQGLALSYLNKDSFDEAIMFLKDMSFFFNDIKFVKQNSLQKRIVEKLIINKVVVRLG